MKELYEFRVQEQYADRLFGPDEGEKLDKTIRKIELSPDHSKFKRVGELNALIQKEHDDFFFGYWTIRRHYTREELASAELFLLRRFTTFEPAGEECGTQYDELSACTKCQAGARQSTPLFLDWSRIPKSRDIARTIAGEIVVSRRWVDLFERNSITGAEFQPIRHRPASSAESKKWFQLVTKSCEAEITSRTRAGINPFNEDKAGEYRCPLGDLLGLARLSEAWISRPSYNGSDIVASRQFFGMRSGLLRPERLLLASPKLRRLIEEHKLRGCKLEIAHFDEGS